MAKQKLYCGRCGYVVTGHGACPNCGFVVTVEESSQKIDVAERMGAELRRRRQMMFVALFACAVAVALGVLLLGSRTLSEGATIRALLEDPVGDLGLLLFFGGLVGGILSPFLLLRCPACESSMVHQMLDLGICRSCGVQLK